MGRMVLLKCFMTKRICCHDKPKTSLNVVQTHCVIHHGALASRNLPATVNDKLAIDIHFVKSKPFIALRKSMATDHGTLSVVADGSSMAIKELYASSGLRAEEGSGAIPQSLRKSESFVFYLQQMDFNRRWHILLTFSKRITFSTDICKAAILAA